MIVGLIRKNEEIKLDWDYALDIEEEKERKLKNLIKNLTPEERKKLVKIIKEMEKEEKTTIEKDNGILN